MARRVAPWGGAIVSLLAFVYAARADLFGYVGDDAGITLRYAERIARGKGFNYNDGEAINGCSNTLYAICEAVLFRLGLDATQAIRLIAAASLAGTAFLLLSTFARFYSFGAALFSVLALLSFPRTFGMAFDGLESPLVYLLVALLFRALHSSHAVYSGIALGLLVANKLDGALAAIAFTLVFVLDRRRFPLRTAMVAFLTVMPFWIYLLISFGSIIPNSMVTKMFWQKQFWDMDHLWMHRFLSTDNFAVLYWAAWASMAWLLLSRKLSLSLPIVVLQAWFVIHMVVYSTVNLGGPIPWYASVPTILSLILSSFVVHVLSSAVIERAPGAKWPRVTWYAGHLPARAWIVAPLALIWVCWTAGYSLVLRLRPPGMSHGLPKSALHDLARQSAGAWLRKHTSQTELLCSFVGLPAFEYEGPYLDTSRLNSRPDPERALAASYLLAGACSAGAPLAWTNQGRSLVATFVFDADAERYDLYARPDSEIARNGQYHLIMPWPTVTGSRNDARIPRPSRLFGRVLLNANGRATFHFSSPGAPVLCFRPMSWPSDAIGKLAVSPSGDLGASAACLRLTLSVNGQEQYSRELALRENVGVVSSGPLDPSIDGNYDVTIDATLLGAGDPKQVVLRLTETYIRVGEPLGSEDFKLASERCRRRVDYVKKIGIPFRHFDR